MWILGEKHNTQIISNIVFRLYDSHFVAADFHWLNFQKKVLSFLFG